MNIQHLYLTSLKSALQGDLSKAAHFYSEAEKCKEELGLDFSENAVDEFPFIEEALTTLLSSYDFTRCMRANGTFYGTRGKCKSGSEASLADSRDTVKKSSHKAAKEAKPKRKDPKKIRAKVDELKTKTIKAKQDLQSAKESKNRKEIQKAQAAFNSLRDELTSALAEAKKAGTILW